MPVAGDRDYLLVATWNRILLIDPRGEIKLEQSMSPRTGGSSGPAPTVNWRLLSDGATWPGTSGIRSPAIDLHDKSDTLTVMPDPTIAELLKRARARCSPSSSSRRKTRQGLDTLRQAAAQLLAAHPDFVTVTYGAGGSTRERTLEVCEILRAHGFWRGHAPSDLRRVTAARNWRNMPTSCTGGVTATSWRCAAIRRRGRLYFVWRKTASRTRPTSSPC